MAASARPIPIKRIAADPTAHWLVRRGLGVDISVLDSMARALADRLVEAQREVRPVATNPVGW